MSNEIRSKLQEEKGIALWEMLQPHYKRDALFLVDESLDLLEVGVAVASDDATKLNKWLENDLVSRPTEEESKAWDANKETAPSFAFVILQPFVFAQIQAN